jgi:hypothetical protein
MSHAEPSGAQRLPVMQSCALGVQICALQVTELASQYCVLEQDRFNVDATPSEAHVRISVPRQKSVPGLHGSSMQAPCWQVRPVPQSMPPEA